MREVEAQTVQDGITAAEASVSLFGPTTTVVFIMVIAMGGLLVYMLKRDTKKDLAHEEEKADMRGIFTKAIQDEEKKNAEIIKQKDSKHAETIQEKDRQIQHLTDAQRETDSKQWTKLYEELSSLREAFNGLKEGINTWRLKS